MAELESNGLRDCGLASEFTYERMLRGRLGTQLTSSGENDGHPGKRQ
jgi:hypothetical protein